jgi:hypothetical protein
MLEWTWATERLAAARNYWIVTSSADGGLHAAPSRPLDRRRGGLQHLAGIAQGRNLAHDPRVVVHLESGDEVVIVEGEVETIGMEE